MEFCTRLNVVRFGVECKELGIDGLGHRLDTAASFVLPIHTDS